MNEIQATLISTGIATVVATLVSIVLSRRAEKKISEQRIIDKLFEINRISLEHPSLESTKIVSNYPNIGNEEEIIQYESYCCLLFNVLEELWVHCNGDINEMNSIVGMDEIIKTHKQWWNSPKERGENVFGYKSGFVTFVDNALGNKTI